MINNIVRVGEEIQSLSRFVGAQRLAFQKLLKKYKKWTGSADLGDRFRREILDRPTSFSKKDFEPLLGQWTEVLAAVRAPFNNGVHWRSKSLQKNIQKTEMKARKSGQSYASSGSDNQGGRSQHWSHSVANLNTTWENGSDINRDTALSTVPLGRGGSKAVYWIHLDNIVQIHVLLLQYTRLQTQKDSITSPGGRSSSRSSPRGSFSAHTSRTPPGTDEETGVIICDDLQGFAKRRNSETVGEAEDVPGTISEKAAASIRYSSHGDVVIAIATDSDEAHSSVKCGREFRPRIATFKRKAVRQLFDISNASVSLHNGDQESDRIAAWIVQHPEVRPLVQMLFKRTRFVGLKNSNAGGIWVTLDKNVSSKRCSTERVISGEALHTHGEGGMTDSERFPHAILEVRTEGYAGADLMMALDESHLVSAYQNCGFSAC